LADLAFAAFYAALDRRAAILYFEPTGCVDAR